MDEQKKVNGLILYPEMKPVLSLLSPDQKAKILDAILGRFDGESPDFSGDALLNMAWVVLSQAFERDAQHYAEKCEKSRKAINERWNRIKSDTKNTDVYGRIKDDTKNTDVKNVIRNIPTTTTTTTTTKNKTPLSPLDADTNESAQKPPPKPRRKQTGNSRPELVASIEAYAGTEGELHDALVAFEDMRRQIRKPLTGEALRLSLAKLDKLAGEDVPMKAAIVQQSVQRGWAGLFELKPDGSGNPYTEQASPEFLEFLSRCNL